MSTYSEQDLKYAAQFREEIHKEALAIARKTRPELTQVIDRHPVEEYFQEIWEYPGTWYPVVAIPRGYKSREALVDTIVRDTLAGNAKEMRNRTQGEPDGDEERFAAAIDELSAEAGKAPKREDPFYRLLGEYPDLAVDYCIVTDERYGGADSHRAALKTACGRICRGWTAAPDRAIGKSVAAGELFSSDYPTGKLNYRRAFLYPPHENGYTGKDFVRVNAALFPNGTDGLEVYEWSTDWSEYFDEGHEWWGALCLTVYDRSLDRFVVIMASATD